MAAASYKGDGGRDRSRGARRTTPTTLDVSGLLIRTSSLTGGRIAVRKVYARAYGRKTAGVFLVNDSSAGAVHIRTKPLNSFSAGYVGTVIAIAKALGRRQMSRTCLRG